MKTVSERIQEGIESRKAATENFYKVEAALLHKTTLAIAGFLSKKGIKAIVMDPKEYTRHRTIKVELSDQPLMVKGKSYSEGEIVIGKEVAYHCCYRNADFNNWNNTVKTIITQTPTNKDIIAAIEADTEKLIQNEIKYSWRR